MKYTEKKEALEWDVVIWGEALNFWHEEIRNYLKRNRQPIKILEIGSRSARLSYWLYTKFPGNNITCSDYCWNENNIISQVKSLDSKQFVLATESVTELSYQDEMYDIVIFKSVLGGLQDFSKQKVAIEEIHRVLKPNGILLFAENLKSTKLHQSLRKFHNKFPWRYLNLTEFDSLLIIFSAVHTRTIGYISLFFQKFFFRIIIGFIDKYVSRCISKKRRYVIYGVATK